MKKFDVLCLSAMVLSFPLIASATEWIFSELADEFTDAVITSYSKDTLTVRCRGAELDIYIDFDDFLSNRPISVKYRFDKQTAIDSKWSVSTDGTAVFVDSAEKADFFRSLNNSSRLIINAYDFRGTAHFLNFDLSGSELRIFQAIGDHCGIKIAISDALKAAKSRVTSYQSAQIEKWGPKKTKCAKSTLSHLGYLDAADINIDKDERLYDAVAKYNIDYPRLCQSRVEGMAYAMCAVTEDGLNVLYGVGKFAAKDKEAWTRECGGRISE